MKEDKGILASLIVGFLAGLLLGYLIAANYFSLELKDIADENPQFKVQGMIIERID